MPRFRNTRAKNVGSKSRRRRDISPYPEYSDAAPESPSSRGISPEDHFALSPSRPRQLPSRLAPHYRRTAGKDVPLAEMVKYLSMDLDGLQGEYENLKGKVEDHQRHVEWANNFIKGLCEDSDYLMQVVGELSAEKNRGNRHGKRSSPGSQRFRPVTRTQVVGRTSLHSSTAATIDGDEFSKSWMKDADDESRPTNCHSPTHSTQSDTSQQAHYINAIEGTNADPLCPWTVCREVLDIADRQVGRVHCQDVEPFACIVQAGKGRPTVWSKQNDKIACWDCCSSHGRVCMRYLGGDAYVILPLPNALRRRGAGPEDKDYWMLPSRDFSGNMFDTY